jgi:hypothetical protein
MVILDRTTISSSSKFSTDQLCNRLRILRDCFSDTITALPVLKRGPKTKDRRPAIWIKTFLVGWIKFYPKSQKILAAIRSTPKTMKRRARHQVADLLLRIRTSKRTPRNIAAIPANSSPAFIYPALNPIRKNYDICTFFYRL